MRASVHVFFIVPFGSTYCVIIIFRIHGQKMRFSAGSQISISEKSISGYYEAVFLNAEGFFTAGWLFPVGAYKEQIFRWKR